MNTGRPVGGSSEQRPFTELGALGPGYSPSPGGREGKMWEEEHSEEVQQLQS